MAVDLSDVGPAALIKELLRLEARIRDAERKLEEDRKECDRIRSRLTEVFDEDTPRYFHGDYGTNIIRVDWLGEYLLIDQIDLEWLHDLEYGPDDHESPAPTPAPEPVTAHD